MNNPLLRIDLYQLRSCLVRIQTPFLLYWYVRALRLGIPRHPLVDDLATPQALRYIQSLSTPSISAQVSSIYCVFIFLPRILIFSNPSIPPNHIATPFWRQPLPRNPPRRFHHQSRRYRFQPQSPATNDTPLAVSLIIKVIPSHIAIPARQNLLHLHTLGISFLRSRQYVTARGVVGVHE